MRHMKKSLFFTTVMMVVLLVVALSTATFAWYISNNTAITNSATVTSAASSSANIGIGWTAGSTGTNISFDNVTALTPAIPASMPITNLPSNSNANAAQTAIYVAVDEGNAPESFVSGGMGGTDFISFYDITDVQVTAAMTKTELEAKPYYFNGTVSPALVGIYERVYHTISWYDNGASSPVGDVTISTVARTPITIYEVVETGAIAGQCTTAQAFDYVGSYVAAGHYIFSYNVYSSVVYNNTIPTGGIFDFFCTANGTSMNGTDIQKEDVTNESIYHVTPSATNRKLYCTAAAVAADSALASTTISMGYVNAPINSAGYFTANGTSATIAAMQEFDTGTATMFYVSNNSANISGAITMTIATSGDNAAILRVAVYLGTNYIGTLGTGTTTYYGTIANSANSTNSLGTYLATNSIVLPALPASASHNLQIIAWYDGVALASGNANKVASFTLTFTAA